MVGWPVRQRRPQRIVHRHPRESGARSQRRPKHGPPLTRGRRECGASKPRPRPDVRAAPRRRVAGGGLVGFVPHVLDPAEQRDVLGRRPTRRAGSAPRSRRAARSCRHRRSCPRPPAGRRRTTAPSVGSPVDRQRSAHAAGGARGRCRGGRARRAVLGVEQRIGRAERQVVADPDAALELEPLRARAADVVVSAERSVGADARASRRSS